MSKREIDMATIFQDRLVAPIRSGSNTFRPLNSGTLPPPVSAQEQEMYTYKHRGDCSNLTNANHQDAQQGISRDADAARLRQTCLRL